MTYFRDRCKDSTVIDVGKGQFRALDHAYYEGFYKATDESGVLGKEARNMVEANVITLAVLISFLVGPGRLFQESLLQPRTCADLRVVEDVLAVVDVVKLRHRVGVVNLWHRVKGKVPRGMGCQALFLQQSVEGSVKDCLMSSD